MRSIGRAARLARRVRRLTQEDVAERVGVSTQFYGRIERGYALPSVTTLRRMLEVLDLRADELLGALVSPGAGGPGASAPVAGDPGDSQAEDADSQLAQEMENPRLRRLMRFLRRASPVTLEVVEVLLDQMDRAGERLRAQGNAGGERGPAGDDAEDPEDADDDPEDDNDLLDEIGSEGDLPDEIDSRDRPPHSPGEGEEEDDDGDRQA